MGEDFGNNFVSITDGEGNEYEMEHLSTIEVGDDLYMAFLPADMDEDDEHYGVVIFKVVFENGEEILVTIDDDDEMDAVYEQFLQSYLDDE